MVTTAHPPESPSRTERLFATMREVCTELRVSESTLRRWIHKGDFPSPKKVGPRTVRFRVDEIREWLSRVYNGAAIDAELAEQDQLATELRDRIEQTK